MTEPCPICNDSGWTVEREASPCPCGAAARHHVARELERGRFPRAFLRDGEPIPWVARGEEQAKALATVEAWADAFSPESPGLWIAGRCGTGKSHLAAIALFGVFRSGATGVWWNVADLLAEIQGTFNGSGSAEDVLFDALRADCVVLDDLGATKATDWSSQILLRLINNRIDNNRTSIITTNNSSAMIKEMLGDRIESRCYDIAPERNKIVCVWPDYRIERHKGNGT